MNEYLKKFCASFDQAYVLSFDGAKNRHESVIKQLEGCRFEFFMGMDKSKVTIDQLKAEGVYNEEKSLEYHPYKVALSTGEIACSWGHREIYRDLLNKKFKHTLILEDDMHVRDETLSEVPKLLENIPKDADLIYWGYGISSRPGESTFFKKLYGHAMLSLLKLKGKKGFYLESFPVTQHKMINNIYPQKYNANYQIAGAHYYTHAYSINEKCAEVLLDIHTPISIAADHALFLAIMRGRIKAYLATPMIFLQNYHTENPSMPSTIQTPA